MGFSFLLFCWGGREVVLDVCIVGACSILIDLMLYNNGFNTENTTTDRGGRICRQDGCSTVQFFQLFIFCRRWACMTIFHKHVCSVHLFLPCLILKILSVSWQWQWKARLCTHYEKYFLFACCLWGMNSWKGASILSRFTSSPFCGCDFSAGREGDLSFFFSYPLKHLTCCLCIY